MIRTYISLVNNLSNQHPEHTDELNVIKVAMEMLLLAENQLDTLSYPPLFSEMMIRESVGTLIGSPLKSTDQDIYRHINQNIVSAVELMGAKRAASHLQRLLDREAMLIRGVFKEKERMKRQTDAKHHGEIGGSKQKDIVKPLQQEIKKLFRQAMQERPNLGSKKAYANYIHNDVEAFIQRDPERYAHVGPKNKTLDYPYQRYIVGSVVDIKLKK